MNRRFSILALGSIASFVAIGDRYVLSTLYGQLMGHYSIQSTVVFSFLFSSFYVGYTIFQIPGGSFAQRHGPSKVVGISLISWSLMFFLIPLTRSFVIALVIAFLFGLSQGPVFPSMIFLLRLLFNDRQFATATGVLSAIADLAPAVIPAVTLALYYLGGGLDLPIFVFAIVGIALGIFFISRNIEYKERTEKGKLSTFLGYRYLIFGFSFLVYDFFYYIFLTYYPLFLKEKFSISVSSFVYGALPWIIMAFGGLLFGLFMDRINKDAVISAVSYAIVAASTIGIALSKTPEVFLFFILVIFFFMGPVLIASWRLSTRLAGERNSSFVGGWMNFWGNVGGITAPITIASLNYHFGLSRTFLLSASVPILGLILWVAMSRWYKHYE